MPDRGTCSLVAERIETLSCRPHSSTAIARRASSSAPSSLGRKARNLAPALCSRQGLGKRENEMDVVDRRTFLRRSAVCRRRRGRRAGSAPTDRLGGRLAAGLRGARPRPRPARRRGQALAAYGLRVPLLPRHRVGAAADRRRRDRAARASRRDGRVPRSRRKRLACPQPRDQQPGRRDRGRHAVRPHGTRHHDDGPGDPFRRGPRRIHEPERHADELRRGCDPVGYAGSCARRP